MPAKAGIQNFEKHNDWTPVFTGVTVKERTGYKRLQNTLKKIARPIIPVHAD